MAADSVTVERDAGLMRLPRWVVGAVSVSMASILLSGLMWMFFPVSESAHPLHLERVRFLEKVRQHGGEVFFTHDAHLTSTISSWVLEKTGWNLPGTPSSPHVHGSEHLVRLRLSGMTLADGDLQVLGSFDRLEQLKLIDTRITASKKWLSESSARESDSDVGLQMSMSGGALEGPVFPFLKSSWNVQQFHIDNVEATEDVLAGIGELETVESLALRSTSVTDLVLSEWADLSNLQSLRSLEIASSQITDWGLAHLAGFPNLHYLSLDLDGSKVTDVGLKYLTEANGLVYLSLARTEISDEGVAHLAGWSKLQRLNLADTHIGDAALVHLARLRNLTILSLRGSPVSDAGLQHLVQLKQLKFLDLTGTKVTEENVWKFDLANPNLKIER